MFNSSSKTVWVSGLILATLGQVAIGGSEIKPAQAGQDGPSKTVFIDGQTSSLSFDLSGSRGRDGRNAADSKDEYGHSDREESGVISTILHSLLSPKKSHHDRYDDDHSVGSRCHNAEVGKAAKNITMPSGSDGASGENGGNGGNGGDLTVYYESQSNLKKIFVNAAGGSGGSGGLGGRGQRGCSCPQSSWTVDGKTYTCTSGSHGDHGRNGASGNPGKTGQLKIIAGKTPIAGDNPVIQNSLAKLTSAPIALSLNRWDTRSGASQLLQSGSTIQDEYLEYRDRLEKTATVQWKTKGGMTPYQSQLTAAVKLQYNGKIGFDFTEPEVWSMMNQVDDVKGTTVTIESVVRQEDALKLSSGLTDKQKRDFTLAVIDTGATSDIVTTSFWVKVKSSQPGGRPYLRPSETHFEGVVPANLVKQDYNRFLLNIGGLPISEDVFQSGQELEVEIRVNRSLGNRSATRTIDWSGTIN